MTDTPWFSQVEPARTIEDPDSFAWDLETDFLVAGSGAAGSSAAAEALEQGLNVTIVDRYAGGGASAASGGVIYAGGGTAIQREAGVEDTPEEMFRYLSMETQGCVSDATLRRFCEQSRHTLDWLVAKGVEFRATLYPGKTSYPQVDYFLYHSDNSLLPDYAARARPAARGHRGAGRLTRKQMLTAVGLGGSIIWPLHDWIRAQGGRFMPYTEVRQLLMDPSGRVIGAQLLELPDGPVREAFIAEQEAAQRMYALVPPVIPGAQYVLRFAVKKLKRAAAIEANSRVVRHVRARSGVCLAAGGFIFNRRMVAHHAPRYRAGYPLGTSGDDGSGIHLGLSAGGTTDRMDNVTAWRFINPPAAWARGIVVNRAGQRVCNEMAYGAKLGHELGEKHGGEGWLILDQDLVEMARQQIAPGLTLPFQRALARLNMMLGRRKAGTLDALAKKVGIDPAGLVRSVDAYNRAAAGEVADAFGKPSSDCAPLLRPPFMAIDVGLAAKLFPCPTLTLGGLVVNEDTGQVRQAGGGDIAGLYAAGRTAVGVSSGLYVSGLSIADGVFSGRRAGLHAARGTTWSSE
ncbi:MAG: FAD-binding protein [Steroidobacteraceae bacterium]